MKWKPKSDLLNDLKKKTLPNQMKKWHILRRPNFRIIIFRKKIYSPSQSHGVFLIEIFLKLHRAQVTNFPERNFWVCCLYVYASITTTTTIFSDLYLPNGLLLQGIIIIVWVKFFQRWIILAENPIKKLELFFRPTLINTFCSFRKGKIKLDY